MAAAHVAVLNSENVGLRYLGAQIHALNLANTISSVTESRGIHSPGPIGAVPVASVEQLLTTPKVAKTIY